MTPTCAYVVIPNDRGHYRKALDADADFTHVLESLLHIHHNRYRGIDRDGEGACRRLARQAALARRACLPETA